MLQVRSLCIPIWIGCQLALNTATVVFLLFRKRSAANCGKTIPSRTTSSPQAIIIATCLTNQTANIVEVVPETHRTLVGILGTGLSSDECPQAGKPCFPRLPLGRHSALGKAKPQEANRRKKPHYRRVTHNNREKYHQWNKPNGMVRDCTDTGRGAVCGSKTPQPSGSLVLEYPEANWKPFLSDSEPPMVCSRCVSALVLVLRDSFSPTIADISACFP